eukprot:TRINITY_DN404_c0_g2_i1.p1 TRINITY_DN404_c0_g2~~TRINITY_DN404_c0_g2_i1.p1  ORF type:complete len:351 (+),score=25.06 TRINITY_DN404_c0_g2_i1:67-1053(+)
MEARRDHAPRAHPSFYCRLSNKIMDDPVIAADEFVYERDAIQEHLKKSRTSPITGETMEDILVPHDMLRGSIDEYKKHCDFAKLQTPDDKAIQEMVKLQQAFDVRVSGCIFGTTLNVAHSGLAIMESCGSTLAQWTPVSGMNSMIARTSLSAWLPHVSDTNLCVAAGVMVLAAEVSWHTMELYRGKIPAKQFWERTSTAVRGAGASCALSLVGGMLWPGVGNVIGSIVGGVIGRMLNGCVVRNMLDAICPEFLAKKLQERDHRLALEAFHLTTTSEKHQVMNAYRAAILEYHPDKAGENPKAAEEYALACINFHTIKNYRLKNNKWTD